MILPRPGNWCYRAGARLEWTRIYRHREPFQGWMLFCHVRRRTKRDWRPFCWVQRRMRAEAEASLVMGVEG